RSVVGTAAVATVAATQNGVGVEVDEQMGPVPGQHHLVVQGGGGPAGQVDQRVGPGPLVGRGVDEVVGLGFGFGRFRGNTCRLRHDSVGLVVVVVGAVDAHEGVEHVDDHGGVL